MHLNRTVNYAQGHIRSDNLDLRDLALGNLVTCGVHHVSRVQGQQASLIDLNARLSDQVDVATQHRQALTERFTLYRTLAHQFQSALCCAD